MKNEKLEATLEAQAPPLTAIDQATLTPLVRSALNSETVEVANWEHKQLHAGAGAGSSVCRFAGQAHDQEQMIPWSLILKVLQLEDDKIHPAVWDN